MQFQQADQLQTLIQFAACPKINNIILSIYYYYINIILLYITSDKFKKSGNEPAKYDPTSITIDNTHNIVVCSILTVNFT